MKIPNADEIELNISVCSVSRLYINSILRGPLHEEAKQPLLMVWKRPVAYTEDGLHKAAHWPIWVNRTT